MPEEPEDTLSPDSEPCSEDAAEKPAESEQLQAIERKVAELTDLLKRTQAEFENYKKRVERDAASRTQQASERLVSDLLSVLDTLDEAIADSNDDSSTHSTKEGLEGIRKQFNQVLRRAGVTEVDTKGPFDPFVHEAMMREETDSVDEGTILETFQKGYMLGPKVVRTAKVKVSVKAQNETEEDHDNQITGKDDEDDEESKR